jgi:hypothetical protein
MSRIATGTGEPEELFSWESRGSRRRDQPRHAVPEARRRIVRAARLAPAAKRL